MKLNRLLLFAFVVSLVFSSCDKEPVIVVPPDSNPIITLLTPSQGYSLNFRGQSIPITFRLDDNEQLNEYWVTETWVSAVGTEYYSGTYTANTVISGTNAIRSFSYTVPLTTIQDYTTITLTGYVKDNKGKVASAKVKISVLPEQGTASPHVVQAYNDLDSIYSVLTGSGYYFSFVTKTNQPTSPGLYDIGEVSVGPTPGFTAILKAPNQPTVDSVFAITNASMFNYDELTWQTTWQAYVTSNRLYKVTPPLSVGDIVIMKMVTPGQFAIIKIVAIWDNSVGNGARIIFSYKYTHS